MIGRLSGSYYFKAFSWGFAAKILDAACKVLTVPALLATFGKEDYALIALAMSVNAYLNLLDMGLNTGVVKFFAEWLSQGRKDLVDSVFRSSLLFFVVVGGLNALILVVASLFAQDLFSVTPEQGESLSNLLKIVACFAIWNWMGSALNQILVGSERVFVVHRIDVARSLGSLGLVYFVLFQRTSLETYFLLYSAWNALAILPMVLYIRANRLVGSLRPGWFWPEFRVVFRYSLGVVALGLFQMTASYSRPILLGIYSSEGIGIVSQYRVMETVTAVVISVGAIFSSIFLPKASKVVANSTDEQVSDFICRTTKITSVVVALLTIPLILNAERILEVYVGPEFAPLHPWLALWLLTILTYLHSSPASSVLLSKGRTGALVATTALSCAISIALNILLCPSLGVGSAVIGFAAYIAMQMSWYYLYFYRRLIQVDAKAILGSFLGPTVLGCGLALLVHWIPLGGLGPWFEIVAKSSLWGGIYLAALLATGILPRNFLNTGTNP